VALHSQTTEDLTELRSLGSDRTARDGTPWYEVYDGEKVVLFGHWPAPEPRRERGLSASTLAASMATSLPLTSSRRGNSKPSPRDAPMTLLETLDMIGTARPVLDLRAEVVWMNSKNLVNFETSYW